MKLRVKIDRLAMMWSCYRGSAPRTLAEASSTTLTNHLTADVYAETVRAGGRGE